MADQIREQVRRDDMLLDAVCCDWREQFAREVVRPAIERLLDEWYANGVIPLPPLGWGRTEPWYVGDLV